jgi:hypothetical protein
MRRDPVRSEFQAAQTVVDDLKEAVLRSLSSRETDYGNFFFMLDAGEILKLSR